MRLLATNLALLCLIILGGLRCAGPAPIEEYTIARTALDAAKDAGAPSFSPGNWHKAEEYYRKGTQLFREHYNVEAKEHFDKARDYAEKAENVARLKKFRSGEAFP